MTSKSHFTSAFCDSENSHDLLPSPHPPLREALQDAGPQENMKYCLLLAAS